MEPVISNGKPHSDSVVNPVETGGNVEPVSSGDKEVTVAADSAVTKPVGHFEVKTMTTVLREGSDIPEAIPGGWHIADIRITTIELKKPPFARHYRHVTLKRFVELPEPVEAPTPGIVPEVAREPVVAPVEAPTPGIVPEVAREPVVAPVESPEPFFDDGDEVPTEPLEAEPVYIDPMPRKVQEFVIHGIKDDPAPSPSGMTFAEALRDLPIDQALAVGTSIAKAQGRETFHTTMASFARRQSTDVSAPFPRLLTIANT